MNVHDFMVRTISGGGSSLDVYRDHVLLIVNTASQCGFTPQYAGLQALQEQFRHHRFSVLAFPCNQFGRQDPGADAEIATFCETRFYVTFPVFGKVEVNGPAAAPLFSGLSRACPGWFGSTRIKWNFTKFLVGRDGAPIRRYAPATRPERIAAAIQAL